MTVTFVTETDLGVRCATFRAGLDYFLHSVDLAVDMTGGELVDGIILAAIIHGNVSAFSLEGPRDEHGAECEAPDAARRPVSVYALSKRLRMPYETTRRHVQGLVGKGLCVRVGRQGVIVPTEALAQVLSPMLINGGNRNMAGLISRLDSLGALATTSDKAEAA